MSAIASLFSLLPYSLRHEEKRSLLFRELVSLTRHHRNFCESYRRMTDSVYNEYDFAEENLNLIPFLPVRLFKSLKLQSVPDSEVSRILTSSGTTSKELSRIAVDGQTSILQTKALVSIVTSFIGPKRLPMVIIDSVKSLRSSGGVSARAAGLVGLSNFGRNHFYALNEEMQLDLPGLKAFIEQHRNEEILIFGFTFMVWQYLYQELLRQEETLALNKGILIHGGGWKKLDEERVSNDDFKNALRIQCGIGRVHNFYGMVEQVGSIYMECENGFLHAPHFAEVLIRDYRDWNVLPAGEAGVIQTLSVLPFSYPGHSLLTEDMGVVVGVDDCPCGRKGTRFKVHGRIPKAELRGCSDTHAFSEARVKDSGNHSVRMFIPEQRAVIQIEALCSESFLGRSLLTPFDEMVKAFLGALSTKIFSIPNVNSFPDLAALAFWLRTANLERLTQDFRQGISRNEIVMPRGLAFHIAPANVDTIFVYSWALSMLAGNNNIVRVSQMLSPQLSLLLTSLVDIASKAEWRAIAERNMIVTYPHDEEINRILSSRSDLRVIWGGDVTVQQIRSLPAKPATKDVVFTDKVSACLLNTERYLSMDDGKASEVAHLFYIDSYQFDQKACSSPQIVYFLGVEERSRKASERFWKLLSAEVERRQSRECAASAINKLVHYYELTSELSSISLVRRKGDIALQVARVSAADARDCRKSCGGGFFLDCLIDDIGDFAAFVRPNVQTLVCIGFSQDEMLQLGHSLCSRGIDRIVPVGRALAFSPIWDGFVLFNEFSRRVHVE